MYIFDILFTTHLLMDVDCFHFLAIMNNAAILVHIDVPVSLLSPCFKFL